MLREIARACEDASWDDEVRVVVVTGTGRAFCVGADLKAWGEELVGKPGEYWKWFGRVQGHARPAARDRQADDRACAGNRASAAATNCRWRATLP